MNTGNKTEVEVIFLGNDAPVLCVFIGGYAFLFVFFILFAHTKDEKK